MASGSHMNSIAHALVIRVQFAADLRMLINPVTPGVVESA